MYIESLKTIPLFCINPLYFIKYVIKKIRIGFLCDINPLDRRGWSGTYYKLYETIKKTGADVVWIPLNRPLFANVILL